MSRVEIQSTTAHSDWVFRALLLIAFLLSTEAISSAEEPGCKVSFGLLLPLTGPASLIGERSEQAARLAYDELPAPLRSRISLVFEDTEMKSATGVRACMKLLANPQVIALSGFGSETVAAIADILERRKVPGVFVTPDRTPIEGKKFLFRHWVEGRDMQKVLLPLVRAKGAHKLSLVHSEIPAMQEFASTLSSSIDAEGFQMTFKQNVLPTETDFRTIISSLLSSKPDALFFFLLPPQTSMFMKQLRAVDKNIPVYSYINTENSREIHAADGALEGVTYAGPKFTEGFIQKFAARYHEYPEFASGNIYDIVHILAQGVEKGACSATELQSRIAGLSEFDGALGHYGVRDGNDFRFPVSAKRIEQGHFEFLK